MRLALSPSVWYGTVKHVLLHLESIGVATVDVSISKNRKGNPK